MSKEKLLLFSSSFILAYVFLPVLFRNIPIPFLGELSYLFFITSLVLIKPSFFLSKQMIIFYSFVLVYFFFSPNSGPESNWFERRAINIFMGISLYGYYLFYSKNTDSMRFIFWFTFVLIIVSTITTYLGLLKHPMASRDLASSVYGNLELTNYYKKIGILGYGFISCLAYFIPIVILLYKSILSKYYKTLTFSLILILLLTVIKAQYATQFIFFSFALFLSWQGGSFYKKYWIFILFLIIPLALIPTSFYVNLIYGIANLFSGSVLTERFNDIALTLSMENGLNEGTHISSRYQRIPFLLNEFLSSPIIGGGASTGHVFWLDNLSLYGIIGTIPWIILLRDNYKRVKKLTGKYFFYYQIAFSLFLILGFMKGSGSKEQIILLFFILPLGLLLHNIGILFNDKKLQ